MDQHNQYSPQKTQAFLDQPECAFFVKYYQPGSLTLNNGNVLKDSHIILPDQAPQTWPVNAIDHMQTEHLDKLLAHQPELIILGSGDQQQFPNATLLAHALQAQTGLEVMANAAACRTFNLLASEGRKVALGIIMP